MTAKDCRKSMGVLITGGRAPVCVLLARLFHRLGYRVHTADSLHPALSASSRAVTEHHRLPSPRFETEACAAEVVRLAEEHQLATLVPTCEEIYHLASERERLATTLMPYFPPLEILDSYHSKHACAVRGEQLGLRVPPTRRVTPDAPLTEKDFQRDGILKRIYSRFSSHVVPLVGSAAERRAAVRKAQEEGADLDGGGWIHQEFIRGRAVCTYSLCREGRILYHLAYTTPYTYGMGSGVFYESVEAEPSLRAAAALAEATGFTGQLSLDFIENERGLWLLEANPRATMGLALALSQAPFGEAWQAVLEGRPHPGTATAPVGLRGQMALATLLYGGRNRAPGRSVGRWMRDLLTTRDVLASRQDPGPQWRQLPILAGYDRQARALGITVSEFTTHDIEWNGEPAGSALKMGERG